jgi:hypothetical protein
MRSLVRKGRGPSASSAARATAALLLAAAAPPQRAFDPSGDPRFGDPAPSLRAFLAGRLPRRHPPQHVCVVGYRSPDATLAWVHWREGHRLILWEPGEPWADDALLMSRRQLDLRTDVVATDDEIGGSTYLVTRAWVRAILADCARAGRRVVVR